MKRKLDLRKSRETKKIEQDKCCCSSKEILKENITIDKTVTSSSITKIFRPIDLLIGYHVSIGAPKGSSKGIHNAVTNALHKRCSGTFAIFTGSQRTWNLKGPTTIEINLFKTECKANGFDTTKILPHSSYLINLGCPDADKLQKSRNLFLQEMTKCAQLGITMLNFHPGSTLGQITEEECCKKVAESLNWLHQQTHNQYDLSKVKTVIECTAGQGNNIGYKFEQIKAIIDKVNNKERVGVCIDTCHIFAAGYDLRTKESCEQTFAEFDRIVGFKYLMGMHLNDSKGPLNCRTDRHENLGAGKIGKKCFDYIVNDKRFRNIPMIMETPGENQDQEIDMLFSMVKQE